MQSPKGVFGGEVVVYPPGHPQSAVGLQCMDPSAILASFRPAGTGQAMTSTQLLGTKLYRPRLRGQLVMRPDLLARLNDLLDPGRKLALICAPAGFGKTTLVAMWLSQLVG